MAYSYHLGLTDQRSTLGGLQFDKTYEVWCQSVEEFIVPKLAEYYKNIKKFPYGTVGKITLSYDRSKKDFLVEDFLHSYYLSTLVSNNLFEYYFIVSYVDGNSVSYNFTEYNFSDSDFNYKYYIDLTSDMWRKLYYGIPIEIIPQYSNWLKMHMLDQKIYNANANGKIIEIYEKESNKLVDTVAILGGFITVAGFMKAGSLIAEQPFRDVSNYLKPSTFNEYIMPNYGTASSYVSNLINNSSSVLGNINKLSINQANVEALKQSTVADIGTATATGTFIYGAMGTLAKNILKATLKYGKWVLPAADFLFETTELGVGSDFSYNGIIYSAKTRPVTTQTDNWQYQQTVNTHTSNQATTEATSGTTTQADEHQQADTSAQEGKLNELKDSIKGIKEAISSQAKSIVDTLKAMTVNLSIPEGATIPLGFDTQALKDFFTANKLGFDTGTFEKWLGSHGLGIDTASFQTWLSTHGLNIDTSVLAGLLQDGLRVDVPNAINLNAPDSINLNSPESIQLVADGLKLALDDVSGQSLKTIGDQITARNTLESTRAEKESSVLDLQKDVLQDKKDMAQTNNDLSRANLGVSTSELAVRGAKYGSTEQFNYLQTQQKAFENFHDSKVVTHTDSTGQTMRVQSGLIAFLGETLPALFNEGLTRVMGQNKATDGLLEDVEERLDQVFSTIFSLFNIKVEELPSSTSENLTDFDKDSLEWFEKYQAGKGQSTKVSEVVE